MRHEISRERTSPIVTALQERFAARLQEFRGEVSLIVSPEHLVDCCRPCAMILLSNSWWM